MFQIVKQNYKLLIIIIIIIILILFLITFEKFTDNNEEDKQYNIEDENDTTNNKEDNNEEEHNTTNNKPDHDKPDNSNDIIIVISRYNEDLEWLKEDPYNKYHVIVYNKGNNDNFYKSPKIKKIINLENVGREGHTYLYHIVTNYHNLNNITIFLPGSANLPNKKDYTFSTIFEMEKQNKAVFLTSHLDDDVKNIFYGWEIDDWESTNENNKTLNLGNQLKLSETRPLGAWYDKNFNDLRVTQTSNWGIFTMSKDDIIKNDLKHYIKFLTQIDDHHNPEVGHYIERCWYSIFYPK